jgi:hypothetical protein
MMKLDQDETSFVRDPYEMLGGDYTLGYLQAGEYGKALGVAARAYYFYWKYRPLNAPIIDAGDRDIFAAEETRFGYRSPSAKPADADSLYAFHENRLIVPEPERFWAHGAGKPLLNAVLNLPSLALVWIATRGGPDVMYYQFHDNYHPIFLLIRLVPLLAGLVSILLVHRIVRRRHGEEKAVLAAGLLGLFPIAVVYFPNIHHDALVVPFAIGTALAFANRRYVWGGIAFGLALAAKNSAIFLFFPVGMLVLGRAWGWLRSGRTPEARRDFLGRLRGALIMGVLGVAVMAPFASPSSYALEILSPVVDRPYHPEGAVRKGAFGEARNMEVPEGYSRTNPYIYVFKSAFPFNVMMLYVILALPMLWVRSEDDLERFGFWMLLAMFPYALAFRHQLTYRSLFFLPFFAILAVRCLGRRQILWILGIFLALDLVLCANPIESGSPRKISNDKNLIESVLSGFR